MRTLVVAIAAVTLVGGVARAVGAQTTEGVTPLKCMDSVWQTTPQPTASTNWANVPGFSDHPIASSPIAIDVSALVSGAPVEFRILSTNVGGQTFVSNPGPARAAPTRSRTSGSSATR